ncbi:unnamed protein product, partial [Rotaria sordida]
QESHEDENHALLPCKDNLEDNLDLNFYDQSTNEIEFQDEIYTQLNNELSSSSLLNIEQTKNLSQDNHIVYNNESTMLNSIITYILNDRLTTETLAKNDQLLSDKIRQTSLFKLDKTTSIHSLSPILNQQSNIFNNFYKNLFIFENNNISKNYNLGKHEHWIANATASYIHPFHTYSHQQCFIETNKNLI